MILVAVLCSILSGSCSEHQIPLPEEITTQRACLGSGFSQQVLAEYLLLFPNYTIKKVSCVSASARSKDI